MGNEMLTELLVRCQREAVNGIDYIRQMKKKNRIPFSDTGDMSKKDCIIGLFPTIIGFRR